MQNVEKKQLQRATAPRGVASADDQGSSLGVQDEEEFSIQDIKSENVSISGTDACHGFARWGSRFKCS